MQNIIGSDVFAASFNCWEVFDIDTLLLLPVPPVPEVEAELEPLPLLNKNWVSTLGIPWYNAKCKNLSPDSCTPNILTTLLETIFNILIPHNVEYIYRLLIQI